MDINTVRKQAEEKMEKTIDALKTELSRVRTGRAHPALLDCIQVNYYGNLTPLNQVCNIKIQDAATLSLQVWEKNAVEAIEKAIIDSGLGLNPAVSGTLMRIPVPPLSEERRKDLVKAVHQQGESAKVAIRNIRRDLNQKAKNTLKQKEISQDEEKGREAVIQKVTDSFINKVDAVLKDKEQELMTV